jgi:hypothetical protein
MQVFVNEYRSLLAERLLAALDYETDKEVRLVVRCLVTVSFPGNRFGACCCNCLFQSRYICCLANND